MKECTSGKIKMALPLHLHLEYADMTLTAIRLERELLDPGTF